MSGKCIVCGTALPLLGRLDRIYCGGYCQVRAHRIRQGLGQRAPRVRKDDAMVRQLDEALALIAEQCEELGRVSTERDALREQLDRRQSEFAKLHIDAQSAKNMGNLLKRQLHDANMDHSRELGELRRQQKANRPIEKTQPQKQTKKRQAVSPARQLPAPTWRDYTRHTDAVERREAKLEAARPRAATALAQADRALLKTIQEAKEEVSKLREHQQREVPALNERKQQDNLAIQLAGVALRAAAARLGGEAGKRLDAMTQSRRPELPARSEIREQIEIRVEAPREVNSKLDGKPRRILPAEFED